MARYVEVFYGSVKQSSYDFLLIKENCYLGIVKKVGTKSL